MPTLRFPHLTNRQNQRAFTRHNLLCTSKKNLFRIVQLEEGEVDPARTRQFIKCLRHEAIHHMRSSKHGPNKLSPDDNSDNPKATFRDL